MENLNLKLRVIYLPFLLVAIGTILCYNVTRWLLDIQLDVLPLRADLLDFWLPFFLPWIPVLIWLRKPIRILDIRGKYDNGFFGYQFAMVITIAIPLLISQHYITMASFQLIEVNKIQEISKFSKEKYFKIASFDVDKNAALAHINTRTSGRDNNKLHFYLYLACPFDNAPDIWYGIDYTKQIPNNSNETFKEVSYRYFINESDTAFAEYDVQNVTYFEKLSSISDDRNGFLKAIKKAQPLLNEETTIILTPQTSLFEERLGDTLPWLFKSFIIGMLVILLMLIVPKIDEEELEKFVANQPLQEDELKEFLTFFDPRGATPAATTLLLLNLAVFMIMMLYGMNIMSPTAQELLDLGGNRRGEVLEGQYWRLVTAIFIHSGISHLIMNLLVLGIAGAFLEQLIGKFKLVASFLISGLVGSISSIVWYEHTVSVGASGAIAGWCGLVFIFTIFKIYPKILRDFTKPFLGFVIGTTVIFGFFENIDHAAHLGGLISGCIIGLILVILQRKELTERSNQKEAVHDPF